MGTEAPKAALPAIQPVIKRLATNDFVLTTHVFKILNQLFLLMDRAAKNAMGIGSLEPRYHRARLPQETFSSYRRVARKVISVGTDLMSYVRRHQGETSLAIDESLLRRCLTTGRNQ